MVTCLKLLPVLLVEILGPVVPPLDLLHAAPRAVGVVARDTVIAATLQVQGQQVRTEVLSEQLKKNGTQRLCKIK